MLSTQAKRQAPNTYVQYTLYDVQDIRMCKYVFFTRGLDLRPQHHMSGRMLEPKLLELAAKDCLGIYCQYTHGGSTSLTTVPMTFVGSSR